MVEAIARSGYVRETIVPEEITLLRLMDLPIYRKQRISLVSIGFRLRKDYYELIMECVALRLHEQHTALKNAIKIQLILRYVNLN